MSHQRKLILCVDNDEDTCCMMTALLELSGYKVMTATNLVDGLKLAQNERFELYVLDYNYPDGTGIELCQKIRGFDPHTPVVFCSGYAFPRDREQALQAGAQAYFVKPVDYDALRQTLSELLTRRKNSS